MKKVSIVVPLYNSAEFMKKLVDSVLLQTYKDIELILVDDGSPDDSGKIADEYAIKDNRVLSFHKRNSGCCDARNYGLERATGEYLMFADGDDWLEPNCVEYLVTLMENNNCEMAMTDSIFTTRDRKQNEVDKIRVWSKENAICGILYAVIPIGPWNKIYTTKVVRDHNLSFSVPWFGEGLYFSTMVAQYSNQVAVGHKRIYNYRLNNPHSGTTVHEVHYGINALKNIKTIKDRLVIRTKATLNSADWHICFNCYYLMCYIIWSNSLNQYAELYNSTKRELHKRAPKAIITSKVKLWKKVYILVACFAPVRLANLVFKRKQRRFKADIMK
jgi:glycosyltransferase involved in cell wall biosynthesis